MQERLADYTNGKAWAGDLFAVPPAQEFVTAK
jgi:hypothetical protein